MADADYMRYRCGFCALEFEAAREKRYCSKKCNKAYIRKNGSVPRAEYLARVRENAASKFTCEHCGKTAYRRLSGTNTGPNRYCSMACRSGHAKRAEESRRREREAYRINVGAEIDALRRIAKYVEKPAVFRCLCRRCSAVMIVRRNGGLHKIVCDKCTTAAAQAAKATAKAKRRALERGVAAENVNPILVFERDKWTCQLCGIRTPSSLRGTHRDNAPELDHIIPLSRGGEHTYRNTQCSCRKCNAAKSDVPKGQLLLIG
jgi:Zn finger protein HypA/HybF involved in hydrogenase expression